MQSHTVWQRVQRQIRSTVHLEMPELQNMQSVHRSARWNLTRSLHLQRKKKSIW